jgi:hypothetical protein
MKNLVDWFSEDVVNRKREEIQKLLLRLLEQNNVNIESLNLPKLSFSSNPSESESQVCSSYINCSANSCSYSLGKERCCVNLYEH